MISKACYIKDLETVVCTSKQSIRFRIRVGTCYLLPPNGGPIPLAVATNPKKAYLFTLRCGVVYFDKTIVAPLSGYLMP